MPLNFLYIYNYWGKKSFEPIFSENANTLHLCYLKISFQIYDKPICLGKFHTVFICN